jgi:nucleotide-binding universal stress UspA family protein
MESVLVGVDRSEGSRRAVKFALERARVNAWRTTIAHVINWSPYTFNTPEDNQNRRNRRKAEIEQAQMEVIDPILAWIESEEELRQVEVKALIRHGRPSEVLSDLAEDGHDLLVVGRTGDSGLRTAIFGSTSYRLVQHAPIAVVVVP